jgi:anti-anti-sigma factor
VQVEESELEFAVVVDASGGTWRVRLQGELDVAVAPALRDVLAAIPARTAVEVDLELVSFLDMAGLRPLLELARRLSAPAEVRIVRPSDHIRRVLGVAGVENLLDIEREPVRPTHTEA